MSGIDDVMRLCPVIPVLTIDDARHARTIAEALVAGGLRVLEVTLRTDAALAAIRDMRSVAGAVVGAGTVLNPRQLEASLKAGAQFIVSPGLTEPLAHAAAECRTPFLPGIATASEIMRGIDLGLSHFKFFPAEAAGGMQALKALGAPFSHVRFCPTGGITQGSAAGWLEMPQVLCVGGSWLVAKEPPQADAISAAARAAAELRHP